MKKKRLFCVLLSFIFIVSLTISAGAWFNYDIEFSPDASTLTTHDGMTYYRYDTPAGISAPAVQSRVEQYGHFSGEEEKTIDVWQVNNDVFVAYVDDDFRFYVTDSYQSTFEQILTAPLTVYYWAEFYPSTCAFSFYEAEQLPFDAACAYAAHETMRLTEIDDCNMIGSVYASDADKVIMKEAGRYYENDSGIFYVDFAELPSFAFINGSPSFTRGETIVHYLTDDCKTQLTDVRESARKSVFNDNDDAIDLQGSAVLFWIMLGILLFIPPIALTVIALIRLLARNGKHKKGWAILLGLSLLLLLINVFILCIFI